MMESSEDTYEARYDFSNMTIYFKDTMQMNTFEHLSTYIEDTFERGEQRLYMLDFWNFLKSIHCKIIRKHHFRSMFAPYHAKTERKTFYILQDNFEHEPYSIYMLLKYIGSPQDTKKKLKTIFEENIYNLYCVDSIFELYNDEFLQTFFSVNSRTNIKNAVESLCLDKNKYDSDFRDKIMFIASKISSYISKYIMIRLRVKFTYFVTQNIVFDKTNFGNDFQIRFKFAEHISKLYNLDIFNYLTETPYKSETVVEAIQEFINEKTLQMTIRRLFFDWYSDTERKWTFSNYAKKLDDCSLSQFSILHSDTKMCLDAANLFLNPEIRKAELYIQFIEIYEKVCGTIVNMDSRTKMDHNLMHGEYLEFKCMIHHFRNMIPYSIEKLLILKSNIEPNRVSSLSLINKLK